MGEKLRTKILDEEMLNDSSDSLEKECVSSERTIEIDIVASPNNKVKHKLDSLTCSICLGDFTVGDCVAFSSNSECNHSFHHSCIAEWLTSKHNSCPNCR